MQASSGHPRPAEVSPCGSRHIRMWISPSRSTENSGGPVATRTPDLYRVKVEVETQFPFGFMTLCPSVRSNRGPNSPRSSVVGVVFMDLGSIPLQSVDSRLVLRRQRTGRAARRGNALSFYVDTTTGNWWTCNGGTWVQSGGGGTVTKVSCNSSFGVNWLTCSFGNSTTVTPVWTLTATTGQTSHQVLGTCGSATSFAPCSLVAGGLPSIPLSTGVTGALHSPKTPPTSFGGRGPRPRRARRARWWRAISRLSRCPRVFPVLCPPQTSPHRAE